MTKWFGAVFAAVLMVLSGAAHAQSFNFSASTHDIWNGAPISFSGTLSTDAGTSALGLTQYTILGATGVAEYDGMAKSIQFGFGNLTLGENDQLLTLDALFGIEDFGFGAISFGSPASFVFLSEVGGPVEEISVTRATGAVPEPATWAMLMLGVGLVGAAMRRRSSPRGSRALA